MRRKKQVVRLHYITVTSDVKTRLESQQVKRRGRATLNSQDVKEIRRLTRIQTIGLE